MKKLFANKVLGVVALTFLSLNVMAFGFVINVQAFGYGQPLPIIDTFSYTFLKPHPLANWWIIQWGEDNGTQGRVEGYDGFDSTFRIESENFQKFARLTLEPQDVPGFYVNVDVAEEHTGFPSEIENQWKPTVQKSVQQTAIVRWSDAYNNTGTGGAVGTNGVWMWNSPYDLTSEEAFPLNTAFGFNYNPANSLGGYLDGLTASMFIDNNPVFVQPILDVNMQQWTVLRSVWSVDANGVESVEFFVNGNSIGETEVPGTLGSLSTEMWNDNQHVIFDENGFNVLYENPASDQYFDINFYSLRMVNN